MLGTVKVGDKLRVQIRGLKAYFPDGGVSGTIVWGDPDAVTLTQVCTARLDAENDKTKVPAQRWPVRDVDLRVPQVHAAKIVEAEVLQVRVVRRG